MIVARTLPLAIVLAGVVSACGTTRFTVTRRAPAEVDIPAGKPMAVAGIQGDANAALASALTQGLLETKRFSMLERQSLDAAMKELKLSAEGHIADESAMSFGNMTGAATLVTGEIATADYKENVDSTKSQCQSQAGPVECVMYTRTAIAKMHVVLKVIETESGKLLAAKALSVQQQRQVGPNETEPGPIAAEDELYSECRAEVVKSFVQVVAPHEKQVLVALRTDDDLPELETGNNYARVGNWSAAVEQYQAAVQRAANLDREQQAKALYDLGVGLGYSGAFDEGASHVENAYALDPDDLYSEQVAVIRQFKEEAARLSAQEGAAASD